MYSLIHFLPQVQWHTESNNQNNLCVLLRLSPDCHFWLFGVSQSKTWVHSQSLGFWHVKQMLEFQTDVLYVIDNDW